MSDLDGKNDSNEIAFLEEIRREQQDDAVKRLDYSVGYALAALKSLLFLNGGSVLSLLTIIGNSSIHVNRTGVFWSLVWFVSGISCVLFSYFGAYFSQSYFMNASYARSKNAHAKVLGLPIQMDEDSDVHVGTLWLKLSVLGAVLSFIFFGIGAFVGLFAIT